MKKLELCVLITTMNENITRVKEELLPRLKECNVVISHQITQDHINPEIALFGKNVIYHYLFDKGLSKNRNNAIKYAKGDIFIICDDDLKYLSGFNKTILDAYIDNPEADVITFRAITPNGNFHDKLPDKKFKHNQRTILSVCSWMITFKKDSIIKNNLKFDETFGLGSKYNIGEENIFLKDCLTSNLNVIHIPKEIVIHPEESSGVLWNEKQCYSRGAVFKRMYGFGGGFLLCLIFSILKYNKYKEKLSFKKHLQLILNGFFDFK
ncbi:glycosyltransferase involved in cell wall biosynthesis [Methanococcus maripaludis]|uniref:Glycosyltransferase involved in cell wall biosynthesis n=1 Tax=Methanococcus maripaludis TaxID=39152 RepID=A0A7J9NNE6_METMI|nr:glycosyltransferase family 2 protein [Methanococcus maripaludis]MBA2846973.1 glycosyltransferase involved in cell wall biosynthesis [Methanococcus maripaludis]